jgi:hypothetical protein
MNVQETDKPAGQQPTRSRWLKPLAWLLVAAVVSELALRATGMGNPPLYEKTDYGYRVQPNQHMTRFGVTVNYNAHGMRGAEFDTTPAKSSLRILCVGDSVTNGGVQTADDNTYPAQLQATVRQRGKHAETLTAAYGGWGLANELGWMKANGLFGSHVVVFQVERRNLFLPSAAASTVGSSEAFPEHRPLLAWQELLTRYVAPRLGLVRTSDPDSTGSGEDTGLVPANIAVLKEMVALARSSGAFPVVLYTEEQVHDRPRRPDIEPVQAQLFDAMRTLEVPVVRPSIIFEAKGDREMFRPGDGRHPNTAGYGVIAQEIDRVLAQAGF